MIIFCESFTYVFKNSIDITLQKNLARILIWRMQRNVNFGGNLIWQMAENIYFVRN